MKLLRLCRRMVMALPLSAVIGLMAWYLWLQEEFLSAKTEYDA